MLAKGQVRAVPVRHAGAASLCTPDLRSCGLSEESGPELACCRPTQRNPLKAIFTADAIPFRRSHDLGLLGEQVTGSRPTLAAVVQPLPAYTDWSFAFSYPGGPSEAYPEPLPAEPACALAEVTALRDLLKACSERVCDKYCPYDHHRGSGS